MSVVHKRTQEALDVGFRQFALSQLIGASAQHPCLKRFSAEVAVLVNLSSCLEGSGQSLLVTKLALQNPIDFNQSRLDQLDLVLRDVLAVKDNIIICENVFRAVLCSHDAIAPRSDRFMRLRQNSFVCFHVVVELTDVGCQSSVVNFASLLVLELQHVIYQLTLIGFDGLTDFGPAVNHLHEIAWVKLVGVVFVNHHEISSHVVDIVLDALFPHVAGSQALEVLTAQACEVNASWLVALLELLVEIKLFSVASRVQPAQIDSDLLVSVVNQLPELTST